jgi:hypothetical protein
LLALIKPITNTAADGLNIILYSRLGTDGFNISVGCPGQKAFQRIRKAMTAMMTCAEGMRYLH